MTEELERELPSVSTPNASVTQTSAATRARLVASLSYVEAGLVELESLHAEARIRERDWRRRAELAAAEGRGDLVRQAYRRSMQAAEDVIAYASELKATRALLHDWSAYLER